MKKLLIPVFGLVILAGCTTENETPMELNGDWMVTRAIGMMADENEGTHYIFSEGRLTLSKNGFDNPAKSSVTDTSFTWDNGSMTIEYAYHFDGKRLIVEPKGSDQTLYLEKQ